MYILTLCKYINCSKKEENIHKLTDVEVLTKSIKIQQKKKNVIVCENFKNRPLKKYLQGIAHDFNLNK